MRTIAFCLLLICLAGPNAHGQIIISDTDPQTGDTTNVKTTARTVKFIGLLHDGDYQGIIYRVDDENENRWEPLWGADADNINKGDIISITNKSISLTRRIHNHLLFLLRVVF